MPHLPIEKFDPPQHLLSVGQYCLKQLTPAEPGAFAVYDNGARLPVTHWAIVKLNGYRTVTRGYGVTADGLRDAEEYIGFVGYKTESPHE